MCFVWVAFVCFVLFVCANFRVILFDVTCWLILVDLIVSYLVMFVLGFVWFLLLYFGFWLFDFIVLIWICFISCVAICDLCFVFVLIVAFAECLFSCLLDLVLRWYDWPYVCGFRLCIIVWFIRIVSLGLLYWCFVWYVGRRWLLLVLRCRVCFGLVYFVFEYLYLGFDIALLGGYGLL